MTEPAIPIKECFLDPVFDFGAYLKDMSEELVGSFSFYQEIMYQRCKMTEAEFEKYMAARGLRWAG